MLINKLFMRIYYKEKSEIKTKTLNCYKKIMKIIMSKINEDNFRINFSFFILKHILIKKIY